MHQPRPTGVLFVCLGNICRSPTAQGVFSKLVSDRELSHAFRIDSAGTHDYHVGRAPDDRAIDAARRRGVELGRLRARQVAAGDFDEFDYILAMDHDNYRLLQEICPPARRPRLKLFLDYAPELGIREVPDPYYGGKQGFERVLDIAESAATGLLESILRDRSGGDSRAAR
jgi:protein-tyrosine phosphatase